ncbi:N-acetylmuramoyl-L-alanine amidase [Gammaproteobacteria bacterium]|nr:N-acetylmuramoyl-L-alanine amidase [Gammaproteobacteria bacterium]
MHRFLPLLILTYFIHANEIQFNAIDEHEDGTVNVSFNLEKVAYINSYSLENPSRLVLEINDAHSKKPINEIYNYPIKKIRSSQDNNLTRVVVDLYDHVFWHKPLQQEIDSGVLMNLRLFKDKSLKENMRDIIVAIDAGHGGKYPGAVGPNNILEKDVTLLIAKEIQRTLRDTKGYQPIMIRDGDQTISLNKRYQDARKNGADIFISIHADGFRLSSVKGASVFIWSEEASSTIARNLSDKKRERILAEINNLKPTDFNEDLARELYPNVYENKIKQSEILGTKILDQLKRDPFTKIHKKNVEYADFRVLKSIDIPSVLVESGFITNPEDAARLKGKPGRRMIARSIFLGVHNYFIENPISGTLINESTDYLEYTIQKGDVLSEIAIRFGVTVESISQKNKLNNRPIYPGQILKIYL